MKVRLSPGVAAAMSRPACSALSTSFSVLVRAPILLPMGERRLIAAVVDQAWVDATHANRRRREAAWRWFEAAPRGKWPFEFGAICAVFRWEQSWLVAQLRRAETQPTWRRYRR